MCMCASIMDTCEWTWHPLKEIESYTTPQNEPAKTLHEKNKITNNELEDDGSQTMEDDDSAFDDEEIISVNHCFSVYVMKVSQSCNAVYMI